jgi:hypothetical protein
VPLPPCLAINVATKKQFIDWRRLNIAFGQVLLKLLACEEECQVLLAGGHAVGLVQQLALLLDQFIAEEGADKGPCKDSAMLDTLLQVLLPP